MKCCSTCGREKPLDEFYVKGSNRRARCKSCTSLAASARYRANPRAAKARSRAWALEHPEQAEALYRRSHLARTYDISSEEYDARLAAQDNVCAICGRPETDSYRKYLAVDHDHTNKAVRGLLCKKCNTAIGMLGDDPLIVRAALEYLERGGFNGDDGSPTTAGGADRSDTSTSIRHA